MREMFQKLLGFLAGGLINAKKNVDEYRDICDSDHSVLTYIGILRIDLGTIIAQQNVYQC